MSLSTNVGCYWGGHREFSSKMTYSLLSIEKFNRQRLTLHHKEQKQVIVLMWHFLTFLDI